MKKFIVFNNELRLTFKTQEFNLIFLQLLFRNSKIPFAFKRLVYKKRSKNYINYSKIRNICIVSGKARSVYKDFKISRIALRKLGSQGLIPGIQKSSW